MPTRWCAQGPFAVNLQGRGGPVPCAERPSAAPMQKSCRCKKSGAAQPARSDTPFAAVWLPSSDAGSLLTQGLRPRRLPEAVLRMLRSRHVHSCQPRVSRYPHFMTECCLKKKAHAAPCCNTG